jgi:hypothetical protein
MPTVTYDATLNGMAASQTAWGVDQGNIGTVAAGPSASAVFAPSGTAGGLVNVAAVLSPYAAQRQVMVKLIASQNGANASNAAEASQIPPNVGALTAGGGVGGVGGTGLGSAVNDVPTLNALAAPSGNGQAQGLAFVYPYDQTVWPRGLPAPLLQWTWAPAGGPAYPGDADAIQIKLSTANGSFSYTGTFARPAILSQTGGSFINHPIPQDVWDMATNSAAGTSNPITVSLVVAKGGQAYGPISEAWTIAPTRLAGTIYYNSYGTKLAQNMAGAIGGNGLFGGAVLSIRVGDTAPKLAAGANSTPPDPSGCRVCHSVAANGARLLVQHGENYGLSSAYDLAPTGNTQHVMAHDATFPAVYPDGSMALTESGLVLPLPADTTPLATTGLTTTFPDLGQPAFSPDGTMIAFNPRGLATKQNQTLYVMSFDKATLAFSGATLVADDSAKPAATQPGWPAFFPDSRSVVYHHQTVAGLEDALATRVGAQAQVYWTSLASPGDVTPLASLNGVGYLPKLPAASALSCMADGFQVAGGPTGSMGIVPAPNLDHSNDANMNYEPTVNPIASGGYAWVVFTSRRMYGNVATIPPYCSDPRGVDLTKNVTTKKLWVAAIDLSQAPGADSSHPAFYLPAQELLAGNARGFWVLDPCEGDGSSCMTGDQCCNGFCEPAGAGGALICSSQPGMCSGLQERCSTAADCCDATNLCVNGFCTQKLPTRR